MFRVLSYNLDENNEKVKRCIRFLRERRNIETYRIVEVSQFIKSIGRKMRKEKVRR